MRAANRNTSHERFSRYEQLIRQLEQLRSDMLELEAGFDSQIRELPDAHKASARNLLHYIALRRSDMRQIQQELASLGLSSLGRAESHVLASVEAVLMVLYQLLGCRGEVYGETGLSEFGEGNALLEKHAEMLLGRKSASGNVRIMVTMPSEAAHNYKLVRNLLAQGMDCMRINCAYDDTDAWSGMIKNLRKARQELGKDCRILMDLAGPKLRTGPIEPGPQVKKWRPRRDPWGNVIRPARILLFPVGEEPPVTSADACLPVPAEWLSGVHPGMVIKFFDARGSARSMEITGTEGKRWWAESQQTAYVSSGMSLHISQDAASGPAAGSLSSVRVGELPARTQPIILQRGDTLILTGNQVPGRPAILDDRGRLLAPAIISLTLPEVLSDVRPNEAVWLDDGKIGGIIKSVDRDRMQVEITQARPGGEKLMADKGINLPDSKLRLPALTLKDIQDLPFIAAHADLVGYSFVRSQDDVHELQSRLGELGGGRLGLVLKIETRTAFEELPSLLLAAMRSPSAGVMIARGDLAIECGYERMAEVQEEILWFAEAAHMPVIWATQVLEKLAKEGLPSRAEITDAAMGERAECVMLNKGPFIVEAVRSLEEILRRMQAHQKKKSSLLRKLKLATRFSRRGQS